MALAVRQLMAASIGIIEQCWGTLDRLTQDLMQDASQDLSKLFGHEGGGGAQWLATNRAYRKPRAGYDVQPEGRLQKTRLQSPEDEIKALIQSAATLDDVWGFLLRRLRHGVDVDLLCLSVLDDSGDVLRVRHLYPFTPGEAITSHGHAENDDVYSNTITAQDALNACFISMSQTENHLVSAYARRDTTFSNGVQSLGPQLASLLMSQNPNLRDDQPFHLFSVPLLAKGKPIALVTLGFLDMDAFSQAKLSFVYTIRDALAQLIWNLLLQERMQSNAHMDNLTGLLSYSSFQHVMSQELARAQAMETPATLMLLDINNLHGINEKQGHHVGDDAIRHLASSVRRLIRGIDTVARHGGDDIAVLLPETDTQTAHIIANRFVQGFLSALPPGVLQSLPDLSISIGFATYPEDTPRPDNLIKLAEQALHLAKFKGGKTGASTCIGATEMESLSEKTVLEVFASHVARKYSTVHVPSLYNTLLDRLERQTRQPVSEEQPFSMDQIMIETITSLTEALDAKDRYTRGHSQAVANYAVALAHALKLDNKAVEEIRLAAHLHDIGKIGIPESILSKEGPLTQREMEIMNQHPVIGAEQILSPVTALRPIIPAVRHHHENWDGTGYPDKLAGEDIPLGARIVAIVDAFHALTSDRIYRKALPVSEARKILEQAAGVKFDPHLIDVFFRILTIASPKTKEVVARTQFQRVPEACGPTPAEQKQLAAVTVGPGDPEADPPEPHLCLVPEPSWAEVVRQG
ncbi:MAG: HD domain-containing phosphohydrolase [Candidatus Melainabacteria bacterium]